MNFLALLGWAYDDKTTIMSPRRADRALHARSASARALRRFDYEKLDWLNGVLPARAAPTTSTATRSSRYLRERGIDWAEELVRRTVPLVQDKIATLGEYPAFAGFLFHDVEPDPADARRRPTGARPPPRRRSRRSSRSRRQRIEAALRGLAERLGALAAQGVPADPRRRHRLERLAGAVREPRAARPRALPGTYPGGARLEA